MKFKIECGLLLKILSRAQALIERRQIEEINTKVLMQLKGEWLNLYSRNSAVRLIDKVPVEVLEPGGAVLDPRHFSSLLKEMKSAEPVHIESTEQNWLILKQGLARAKIVAEEAVKYPIFEASRLENFSQIQASTFLEMLNKVSYGAAKEESRHEATKGVYFECLGDKHRLVSTDTYRLSAVDRELGGDKLSALELQDGVTIPIRGVNCLKGLLEGLQGHFKLAISDKDLVAQVGDSLLMVNLIVGGYPNYKKMILNTLEKKVQASRGELLASLRRVILLADPKTHALTLELLPGKIRITSTKSKIGESKEEINVDYKGQELKISFNGQYMLEALSHIEDEAVELSFKEAYLPSIMRYKKDAGHVSVVMPMQI